MADSVDAATLIRLVRMFLDRVVVEGKSVCLVGRFDAGGDRLGDPRPVRR